MDDRSGTGISRRRLLRVGALGATGAALGGLEALAVTPQRATAALPSTLPSIQHDIGRYLAPPVEIDGTKFGFGPVYTMFLTFTLTRTPKKADQRSLERALARIEERYPFRADGVFATVAYGLPYFARLRGGLMGPMVSSHMPRLLSDASRWALEEAVPGPTDIDPSVPPSPLVTKLRYPLPVRIEGNDLLVTLRSDRLSNLNDVRDWLLRRSERLGGRSCDHEDATKLLKLTSTRVMFAQPGLPRKLAESANLPYAQRIHPRSPMWMGFADMVADAFGPAPITCFQGNDSARLTTCTSGDYFYDGSIQVLNHVILDLHEWYRTNDSEKDPNDPDISYLERVQYMYRTNNPPSFGYHDQFTDGGGPTFLPNAFQGADDAVKGCIFGSWQHGPNGPVRNPKHSILGHVACIHRSSRAADGTPIHIRVDGPGFDTMDVPDGTPQPKLQFSAFVPSAEHFRAMRVNMASLDLARQYKTETGDMGLENRITATRRQNFLSPSRAHRAFPLVELA